MSSSYQSFQPALSLYDSYLSDNPDLVNTSGGLALNALQSASPDDAAAVLTTGAKVAAAQQAAQDQSADQSQGWLSSIVSKIGSSPVGTALQWLGKPLQEIQSDYKFLHAVWTKNGPMDGVLATLGIAGGAAAGFFVGDPLLGAAAAAELERQVGGRLSPGLKEAFNASNDPNYKVSMGRDLANLLGAGGSTDSGWGKFLSGGLDATADYLTDPLVLLGKANSAIKEGKSLTSEPVLDHAGKPVLDDAGHPMSVVKSRIPLAAHSQQITDWLASHSLAVRSPDQIDAVFHGSNLNPVTRTYKRALTDIATSDPGEIAVKYGPQWAAWATRFHDAATAADTPHDALVAVHDLVKESLWSAGVHDIVNGPAKLPTRTVMRASVGMVADRLKAGSLNPSGLTDEQLALRGDRANQKSITGAVASSIRHPTETAANIGGAVARKTRTFSGYLPWVVDQDLGGMSGREFDVRSNAAAPQLYKMMRFSMGDSTAKRMLNDYLQIDPLDVSARKSFYGGIVLETIKAAGFPDDPEALAQVADKLGIHLSGGELVTRGTYGHGFVAKDGVSEVPKAGLGKTAQAIWSHQDDNYASFIDFRELNGAVRSMSAVKDLYGKVDDIATDYYTNKFFKPMALLTAGFALRVAASEILANTMRYGGWNLARAKIISGATKIGYRNLSDKEVAAVADNVAEAAKGGSLADYTPDADMVRKVLQQADPDAHLTGAKRLLWPAVQVRAQYGKALQKAARMIDPDDMELAAQISLLTNGHMATGATLMGHGIGYSSLEAIPNVVHLMSQRESRQLGKDFSKDGVYQQSGQFRHFQPGDSSFNLKWALNLQKASQNLPAQNIARDVLVSLRKGRSHDEAWQEARDMEAARVAGREYKPGSPTRMGRLLPEHPYADELQSMTRYKDQSPQELAFARTDDLRNTLTGSDGTFHTRFAQQIAKGNKPTVDDVDRIDSAALPESVAGRELTPYIGRHLLSRISSLGFTKVLDPIVNNLSRQPTFFQATKVQMKALQYAIDTGRMTHEQALWTAMQRATHAMLPQIHNVMVRTQFAVAANNFLPFWFAQQQALRRGGDLVATNPEAYRKYQLVNQGLNNNGFVQKDQYGNAYFTFPGIGELGNSFLGAAARLGLPVAAGIPLSVSGNMGSLKSVLPETNLPGVSPFIAVAADWLQGLDPVLHKVITGTIGEQNAAGTLLQAVFPNAPIRNVVTAMVQPEADQSFQSQAASALASAYFHGLMPAADASVQEKQAFADRIKNNIRSGLIIKALLGTISPLSPTVREGEPGLRKEFLDLVHKEGYGPALDDFIAKHGTKSVSYTVANTTSDLPGAVPYTDEALAFVKDQGDLISGPHSMGASYLVPQAGTLDAQQVRDELLKMHLRSQDSPQEFMDAIYTAAGNNLIYADERTHADNVARLSAVKDSQGLNAEYQAWDAWVQQQGLANPVWFANYDSTVQQQHALKSVQDLLAIYQDPAQAGVTGSQQGQLVGGLLQDWIRHEQQMQRLTTAGVSTTSEKDAWYGYLKQMEGYTKGPSGAYINQDPQAFSPMSSIIRGVFLPLARQ